MQVRVMRTQISRQMNIGKCEDERPLTAALHRVVDERLHRSSDRKVTVTIGRPPLHACFQDLVAHTIGIFIELSMDMQSPNLLDKALLQTVV